LGDGTQTDRDVPVQVLGLREIVGIAGGDVHSVALAKDGTVWVWGANDSGQLGTGDGESHPTPVQVPGVSGAASVGAGDLHTLVLTADGTLFAWGDNSRGQVGDGTQGNIRETPVRVSGLSQVRAIDPGCGHSMALHQDGTVWVWGRSRYDDVGLDRPLPTKVAGLENVVSIAAGNRHSAAVKADGTVWTWGLNWEGQLGTGDLLDQPIPAEMSIPETGKAVQVAAYDITIVRAQTGRLFAAGDNEQGQIGDGTHENRLAAVPVLDETGSGPLLLAAPSPGTDGGGGGNCFLRAASIP
jgi:alpha-tubulin suppressor-like RCC1 family protein